MACEAPWDLGWVMCFETELSSLSALALRAAALERARLGLLAVNVSIEGFSYAACHCGRDEHFVRESTPPKRARDIVADWMHS
jgi:hypothetical protein